MCLTNFGPKSRISYGVLSGAPAGITGRIYFDDEDSSNKNWAKLYDGEVFNSDLRSGTLYSIYGLTTGENTWYSLVLSTDPKFKNNNIYYPPYITYPCN